MITITKAQVKIGGWNYRLAYQLPVEKVEKELEKLKIGDDIPKHIAPRLILTFSEDAQFEVNGTNVSRAKFLEWVSYSIPAIILKKTGEETFEPRLNRTFTYAYGKLGLP